MATPESVVVNFRGRKYVGEYEIAGRVVRVSFKGRTKVGILRGPDAELFARILLIDLVSEAATESDTFRALKAKSRKSR